MNKKVYLEKFHLKNKSLYLGKNEVTRKGPRKKKANSQIMQKLNPKNNLKQKVFIRQLKGYVNNYKILENKS